MTNDIGQFSTAPSNTEDPADKPAEERKPPELVRSSEEFLHEHLLSTYVRDLDGRAVHRVVLPPRSTLPCGSPMAGLGTPQAGRSNGRQWRSGTEQPVGEPEDSRTDNPATRPAEEPGKRKIRGAPPWRTPREAESLRRCGTDRTPQ
jgi:hypothetical protein